ncbi:UDP-glycosyltransferase 86A1 [Ziziphus jujuba]|uniref:UDP-glycosyltransferase 86A1 n=1 Tax=Ziziphus jujuba TaxID=326968 RepID=A0A6P6GND1_ZIZJJ|nr:UDP-glycosyltransferase 86A1 [Ziziphus jujuba]
MAKTQIKIESMENSHPKPHAIMIALHLQSHVIPTVNLAMKLASKGFTITFVNTQAIHHQIIKSRPKTSQDDDDEDIFAAARKSGLDIRYKTVSDGFPVSYDRFVDHDQFLEGFLHVFPAHVDELVGNIVAADPSVSCLIADTFHTWPSTIANKYKLVHISFWTEPALVFTLYYHLDLLVRNGHFASHDNREDTIDYIPGVEAIEPKDLMSYLQETEVSSVMHRILYKAFEDVKKADFILCNTVEELESHAISAIQEKQPIYAIGPVLDNKQDRGIVAKSLRPEFDCRLWLDTKPHGSVLYISFGSCALISIYDMEEIAQGLLLSKVSFVWVLRPDTVSYAKSYVLPVGFEDEIKGRGLIVQWCNQIEVVSHPAVGGFLTHCGWNSVLESVWCGVTMLCFPIFTDQVTNRKLVVDDWRVGLNLCDRKPLTRMEVREKINRLMSGKSAEELRVEMKKIREIVKNAVEGDGLSEKRIHEFIFQVKSQIKKRIMT